MAKDGVRAHVSGLKEIRRELIRSDKKYAPEIRKILRDAADVVAAEARANMPALTGNARASVKGGSSGPYAVVKGGTNKKVPYYGWLDFGGTIRPNQQIDRPFIGDGRYIYPAIARKLPAAAAKLETELNKLIDKGL